MDSKRVARLVKLFLLFLLALLVEYVVCGIYFRPTWESDLFKLDLIGVCGSLVLSFFIFRPLFKITAPSRLLTTVAAGSFLVFCFLGAFFIRYSLQLANGLLDGSEPQTLVIVITKTKISPWGGSLKDGVIPMAHLIYFQQGEGDAQGVLLITPFDYYSVGVGSHLELSLRGGFLHWPWVEDYRILKTFLNRPPARNR